MTTTDPFTTAARRRAEQFVPLDGGEPNLIFRDRRQLVEMAEWARSYLAAQEPDDAEVEAALTALLISESIALGQTADEAADYAIRELETRDLTNLRTGVRCALSAARRARGGTT